MYKTNFDRMIKLAEEFFATKKDPSQITVNEETMKQLREIHLDTLTEKKNKDGPIAWITVFPTTKDLMEQFITKKINERELLDLTPLNREYDAVYLCSALVLPEYRGKGLAKRLTARAIKSILKQHPIKSLFFWAFSDEGEKLAHEVAIEFRFPLLLREK